MTDAPPANTPPANTPPADTPPANTPPAAFDWKAAGLNDIQLGTVQNKQWKDPATLLDSYVNLEKLAKGDPNTLLRLPTTDEPAAWTEVYTKLGRPPEPTGYSFKAPEGADPAFAETAKTWFHEAGLSDKQAALVATKWNEHMAGMTTAQKAAADASYVSDATALKVEWGPAHDTNVGLAKRAAAAFGLDAATVDKMQASMGFAGLMKFMHNLGSRLGTDDKFVQGGDGQVGFSGSSPAGGQARISELMNQPGFAAKLATKDPDALREWDKAFKTAFPV